MDSPQDAKKAAENCASSDKCAANVGVCPTITNFLTGETIGASAMCNCSAEGGQDEEYCWTDTSYHPYTGGCCGNGQCFYALPTEDKCEWPSPNVGDPINLYTGNSTQSDADISFGTSFERGLEISRIYRSQSERDSAIGFGWTHSYTVVLESVTINDSELYKIQDESDRTHYFQAIQGSDVYINIKTPQSYLTAETDGMFTWNRDNGMIYIFDDQLRLAATQDANGNLQTLTYDSQNRLETITDGATGRTLGFIYNADNRIHQITGPITEAVPDGIHVTYQYDTHGNLTHVEYADDNNGSSASGIEYLYEDTNDVHNLTGKRNLAGEFLASWAYDSSDRAYENITRDGRGVTITGYDKSTRVVTDAQGVQKIYSIKTVNGRKTITDIMGDGNCSSCGTDATRYAYDEYRRVIEVEYANGRIDHFEDYIDKRHYTTEIQAVRTPQELTLHYTYHPVTGSKMSITEASILNGGNRETIFDYDDDENDTPNENPSTRMYRKIERGYTFNAVGALEPYEYITTYTYTPKGQIESIDGPLPGDQDTIVFTYDPVTGDRLTETQPLVGTTRYTYDAAGNMETITDPNGIVTTLAYDGRNRNLSTTTNGINTSQTYTTAGTLDTTTDALGRTMDYTYNAQGFMEKVIDPSGNFMFYGYNNEGRQIEQSIFSADNTQTLYSGTDWGDPVNTIDLIPGKPWKKITRNHQDTQDLETVYAYDNSGNLKTVTDPDGRVTEYQYDLFNRLKKVIQPGNTVTSYDYDMGGNLSSVIDAEGHETLYIYDDMNRLVESNSPDTGNTLYSYDETGNLRFKTQNTKTIEYRYDLLGRPTDTFYSDPTQNVTRTYDTGTGHHLLGRLAAVADHSGLIEYSYDAQGKPEQETRTINGIVYTTRYHYDNAGNLQSMTYPTGQIVTYQPDPDDPGRIGSVMINSATLASNLDYMPFGPVSSMVLGNSIPATKTFDKNYQIATISAGSIISRTYTQSNTGQIEQILDNLDNARSQTFEYDALNHLTHAQGIYGIIDYTYDKVGNRKSRTRGSDIDSYTYYPDTNRLQTITGPHAEMFLYDDDGNITQRIPGAGNPSPTITNPLDFTYTSSGLRSQKQSQSQSLYHYDLSGQLIAETDTDGTLIKAYVWLYGQPLSMITQDGSIYYFHNDHLGTPQRMTDSNGTLVWSADYLPFGQADVTLETVENNVRLPGQYRDGETGLHYNWNRYYDPGTGRYLTPDPIGLKGGINLYNYVLNDPVNFVDPEGLCYEVIKTVVEIVCILDVIPIGSIPGTPQIIGEGLDISAGLGTQGVLLADYYSGSISGNQFIAGTGLNAANMIIGTAGNALTGLGNVVLSVVEGGVLYVSIQVTTPQKKSN